MWKVIIFLNWLVVWISLVSFIFMFHWQWYLGSAVNINQTCPLKKTYFENNGQSKVCCYFQMVEHGHLKTGKFLAELYLITVIHVVIWRLLIVIEGLDGKVMQLHMHTLLHVILQHMKCLMHKTLYVVFSECSWFIHFLHS